MKIEEDVAVVLRGLHVEGRKVVINMQLDRKLYLRVNKVLECLGGKWDRKGKAHLFEEEPFEVIADALDTGVVVDPRKEFQFFETPSNIAKKLVSLADVRPGMIVVEPSAGRGAIVKELRRVGVEPLCCELMDRNRDLLIEMGCNVVAEDFLTWNPDEPVDRVVANPPFSRGQDIAHVTKMFEILKPGGKLVSVMTPGWTYRYNRLTVEFRELVNGYRSKSGTVYRREWIPLGDNSFKLAGTGVNTGILVLEK